LVVVYGICYICDYHTAVEKLKWHNPIERIKGQTPDIRVILQFYFWKDVYLTVCWFFWECGSQHDIQSVQ